MISGAIAISSAVTPDGAPRCSATDTIPLPSTGSIRPRNAAPSAWRRVTRSRRSPPRAARIAPSTTEAVR